MKFISLKLVFLIHILFITCAFSQVTSKKNSDSLVTHYNNWLKAVHLNDLVIAVNGRFKAGTADSAAANLIKKKRILILIPAAAWQNPEKFAVAWNAARTELAEKGINIYSLLLDKLADYTFLPPDSLAVQVQTVNPDIFSLNIYYPGQLKTDENIILMKGGSGLGIIGSPGRPASAAPAKRGRGALNFAAATTMLPTCFTIDKPGQMDVVRRKLELFFKRYKHRSAVVKLDSIISHDKKNLRLRIYNIDGEVTGKNYHELINLDISIDNNEICYTVDASYAAGIARTPDPDSGFYREVSLDFPERWLQYRDSLGYELKIALNGK